MTTELHQINSTLEKLAEQNHDKGLKYKFGENRQRAQEFSSSAAGLFFDFSKTHIDQSMLKAYVDAADILDVNTERKRFISGERINNTENRSVLHTLLRDPRNQGVEMAEPEALQQASDAAHQFGEQLSRINTVLSQRKIEITDIIHVGIGGSSLGTQLLFEALKPLGETRQIHFVGNIDAHQLVDVLDRCDVHSTMVIGVSKTFTTAETLQNLNSIAAWYRNNGVSEPLVNFYGVTANTQGAENYGIAKDNTVTFPEWVGGRYSVWSAVSLSAAILLGKEKFDEFLTGAATLDQHFYQTDLADNVCFQAAALDHYYANYMGVGSKAIFAYDFRFRSLVDYLQQLETESNGKDRQKDGSVVNDKTSMVVWGGVGTDVQHSVFQMLHQGTAMIPAEFILVAKADHALQDHHNELLANGIAQTAALLQGQDLGTVERLHGGEGLNNAAKKAKIFSGDKPSMTILLEQLTPKALGALLAFYEHRVYFGGLLTNINSFDQMGVELGKRLAKQVRPLIDKEQSSDTGFDSSTEQLLAKIKAFR